MSVNVLITSAGGTSAINVMQALRAQDEIPVRIVAVDMNSTAAGLFLADTGYPVPRADDPAFIPTLLDLCVREAVNVVIPIFSAEIPVFAAYLDEFKGRGIEMVLPSTHTLRTCNDKLLTYVVFDVSGIPTPRTWHATCQYDIGETSYPLIVKPVVGSGSRHTYRADTQEQLAVFLSLVPHPVIQEFIEGPEYTVDFLADWESDLLAAVPRERLRVSGGKAVIARTISDPEMLDWVQKIVKRMKLVGAGNIQCLRGEGGLYFTEVNARFAAGGLPLAIAAGVNIPLMWLKLALGQLVTPVRKYVVDLVMTRYLTEIFLQPNTAGGHRLYKNG